MWEMDEGATFSEEASKRSVEDVLPPPSTTENAELRFMMVDDDAQICQVCAHKKPRCALTCASDVLCK